MPYQREAEIVLAEWRDAERKLAAAVPGTPDEVALTVDIARYRAEYQDLIGAARVAHRPEPPTLDESLRRPRREPIR
jgi:hypothetical protein